MNKFRVALSGDFVRADGSPTFPDFDLSPLENDPRIELGYVQPMDGAVPAEALRGYDALILLAPRMTRASLPKDGQLALVARFGVGYDNVDVEHLAAEGVATVITPKAVARPVAVGILTLILTLTGKVLAKDGLARKGGAGFAERAANMGVGLVGKTLGSIGMGNIGSETVRICRPLDLRVIAYDPYLDSRAAADLGVRLVDLDAVFRDSDIVMVNCPLTPETTKLVNAERLSMMKSTAYLINTARGPIVDQTALFAALKERRIAGAGLDVYDPEPPAHDDPLLGLDNVVLAPHAIAWTDQCFAEVGAADVRAVLDVMHGRVPQSIVEARVTQHPVWKRRLAEYGGRFAG